MLCVDVVAESDRYVGECRRRCVLATLCLTSDRVNRNTTPATKLRDWQYPMSGFRNATAPNSLRSPCMVLTESKYTCPGSGSHSRTQQEGRHATKRGLDEAEAV